MCSGGIYDQLGGGFYRYSVDMLWKVPHFEKMLYDNGQLISLYSLGYEAHKNESYKNVVYQTIAWMKKEMMDEKGAFYCAIDADSEGEEGKYYCWKEDELKTISLLPNIMGMGGNRIPIQLRDSDIRRILKDDTLEEHIDSKKLKRSGRKMAFKTSS